MRMVRGQLLVVFLTLGTLSAQPSSPATSVSLSADAVVGKLMAANTRRAESLRGYRSRRTYHLHYHGLWGTSDAVMVVDATYTAPDKKEFTIVSQSGSKLLINHVLLKLLASEQAAQLPQNRRDLEITPQNYDFSLDKKESEPGEFYVLNVKPRTKSEYVYRGKIWVDAHDFAEARMQGEPQKNFSMWLSRTEVKYRWANQDGFWLPVHNESITRVRMGGTAVLTIDYSDYQIMRNDRVASAPAQSGTVPDPSVVSSPPY